MPRKRQLFVVGVILCAVLAIGAVGFGLLASVFNRPIPISANGGVVAIALSPFPEGPGEAVFERNPSSRTSRPLSLIDQFIPDPLPPPMNNWGCSIGGNMIVSLGYRTQITYGPCRRPASIDHLWAEMVYVETDGRCAPRCAPDGRPGP